MTNIPFSRASITLQEKKAVDRILKGGWLTMGEETRAFEKEFAKYVGAKYAIAVNSCTSALFLSLKALGVGVGDEVIVPSFTFAATANVVVHCQATPVFVDISENDFVMDQKSFEKAVTKKTKAVIPVHYGGVRATIKTNLPVIEDSAHLIPKSGDNTQSFTRCYSFYATKNMTTGEGGMITFSESNLNEWFEEARLHGFSKDAWNRYNIGSKGIYRVKFSGFKFNTTDINSAIGRIQLKKLDKFEKRRREVVALYNKLLGLNNKGTHLYPILIENRDEFLVWMRKNRVGCSFHFPPLHLEPAFINYQQKALPVTEYVGKRIVTLPLDSVISNQEVRGVAALVKEFKA